jgi:hypothetical protein
MAEHMDVENYKAGLNLTAADFADIKILSAKNEKMIGFRAEQ